MDSSDLYYIKQQFTLGAWRSLTELSPDPSSPDYAQTRLYQARAYVALDEPQEALKLLESEDTSLSTRAVSALARYIHKDNVEKALEELRDLSVEIDEEGVAEKEKGLVRVVAGTAFAKEGEIEEALETLGAGSGIENLDAVALSVQIYLSINRVDLAKKEFDRARRWAEDDLLLQHIEASIGLLTGKDSYSNPHSFYVEQLHNPSLSSAHLLVSRGITHLLRGEIPEAQSDFSEAQKDGQGVAADALAGSVVAAELGGQKENVNTLWSRLQSEYPNHPLVSSIASKGTEFDELAAKFDVPPLAVSAAA
ncbi:hypothetical protein K439DRAFT_1648846 [Ramaria rubella]|nr:hypothetical protein K439DRAFT_1648846 [Ramaria rubella]